jgi:hypothetical protein
MSMTFCSLGLIFLTGVMGSHSQCGEDKLDSKIELHAAYDLPQQASTNTIIVIEKKKNGYVRMNLVYEIYPEWNKPYQIDKQSNCILMANREYEGLWTSLFKEDVFKLKTIDFQGDDHLLYSSPPGIPSPVIYFSFSSGKMKNDYSCLDIEKIVGDKRYLNVLRILKIFIEKHHCDRAVPDWLTQPFRDKTTKTE